MSGLASVLQIMQARNSPEQVQQGLLDMKTRNPMNLCVVCRQQLIMHTESGWFSCIKEGLLRKHMPDRP
jgi:hypothetical protein